MSNEKYICIVCGADVSDYRQLKFVEPFGGWPCCIVHSGYKYISYFMIPFLKKELGYPYIDHLNAMQEGSGFLKAKLDCNVCDELLTEDEIGRIKSTDANFYCSKHEEIKFFYSKEWAKAWFLYKQEINNNAVVSDKSSEEYHRFSEWFINSFDRRTISI